MKLNLVMNFQKKEISNQAYLVVNGLLINAHLQMIVNNYLQKLVINQRMP